MNTFYMQFTFAYVKCCLYASKYCNRHHSGVFSTCSLGLNVRRRDSSAEGSRVFPSHSSIPIYISDSDHPSNKQRHTWLHPTSVWREIFWGSSKIPLIKSGAAQNKKEEKKNEAYLNVDGRENIKGEERGEEIRGFLNVWNEFERHSGYTTQHPIHFLSDTLLGFISYARGFILLCSDAPQVYIRSGVFLFGRQNWGFS